MLTGSEQQELHQIEQGLRETDRGFAWRLTLFQGVLHWAAPGRQAYLLALAVLAAALLRLAAAAGRLLMACAEGAALIEPATLMALGGMAWLSSEFRQAPGPRPARLRTGRSLTAGICDERAGKHRRLVTRVPPGRAR